MSNSKVISVKERKAEMVEIRRIKRSKPIVEKYMTKFKKKAKIAAKHGKFSCTITESDSRYVKYCDIIDNALQKNGFTSFRINRSRTIRWEIDQ